MRREPELPEHEDIAPEPVVHNEFEALDDAEGEDDDAMLKARLLVRQRQQTFTRAAAMDRDDQMLPGL